ncbi:MAG: tetratricopeptide repeat protein [Planctomycetota bacterium]|jgi:tetratricopeptide (TPR) repeat protein
MAGKNKLENKNSKLKTVKLHTFAPCALLFALFVCALLLTGCVETTENEKFRTPQETRITQTSGQEKKQKLLRAIERRFENPDAHFELGQLYQAEGLKVAAEYHYNIALQFDPVHRDSQAAMVKMMADSGNTEKARLQADKYMREVSTSSNGSRRLAMAFQKQGLDDYILACYQQAIRLEPNSAENYKQIGYYYLSKSDKVRARDFLSRSFEIKPNQADVALTLGQLGVEIRIPQKTETNPNIPEKSVE